MAERTPLPDLRVDLVGDAVFREQVPVSDVGDLHTLSRAGTGARLDSADDTHAAVCLLLERLRVLQIIPALAIGGLERVGTTLSVGLVGRVERVVVCSAGAVGYTGGAPLAQELADAGVEVILIPRPKPRPPGRYLRSVKALAAAFRRERPDVVHAHNPGAAVAAAVARRLARRPEIAIVTTHHGVTAERTRHAARALAASSDIVVGIGPTVTKDLRAAGVPESKSATVFNSVAVEPGRPGDEVRRELGAEDAELVVNVGRYVEEKNQQLLLDAVARLRADRPRLRALVIGYGTLGDDLRKHVRELGLEDVVQITGPREDAVAIVAAADVFAMTSAEEGLGLVVLEAMAVGCPVVATSVGGVLDTVRDGETGLLVPAGDPDAFAEGLARALDDPDLRRRLANNGRDLVRREFSVETMGDRYAELYISAVQRRRG